MILLSHPSGNANVRQALLAFYEAGMLREFVSLLVAVEGGVFDRISSYRVFRELQRRRFDRQFGSLTRIHPWPELLRLAAGRFGLTHLIRHEHGFVCADRNAKRLTGFCVKELKRVSKFGGLKAVYCYEDAALETFRWAKKNGLMTIYDLPTGYWRKKLEILEEERECAPEWACLLPGARDSIDKLQRKDEELSLADLVITASSFTDSTLERYEGSSLQTARIGYGSPDVVSDVIHRGKGAKLRVLFVGSLSQQKGISYLFSALRKLGRSLECTIIGKRVSSECRALNVALREYTYIPSLPHSEILETMRRHDVLVFPSLFDGFGLVLLEAMSQGMTVIASTNSGAPDFISNGCDGFVVPIRDSDSICEKLEQLRDDEERLLGMRRAALEKARQLGWAAYRKRLVHEVKMSMQCGK